MQKDQKQGEHGVCEKKQRILIDHNFMVHQTWLLKKPASPAALEVMLKLYFL